MLVAGLLVAALARPADAALSEPERYVNEIAQRALRILRAGGEDARRRELAVLLDETVDLDLLARLVLGRHWTTATPEQRAEYQALFRRYALQGLTSALSAYTGEEQFTVTGARPAGDGDSLVGSDIVRQEGAPPNRIDWRVRAKDGRFVIVDVVIEGVSLLVTNRAEVDSIVRRRGMDGLIAEMRSWSSPAPDHA